jgi:predicted ATP-grasp superfamily ATP-dependent carboligase
VEVDRPVAIVTDGLWRKSLSAIRSLGKAGFHVQVMGESALTTGFFSRYASGRTVAPVAARDPEGFGRALRGLLERYPGAVVLPMEDASLEWVDAHRAELPGRFLLPPSEALRVARDKGATMRVAQQLGLPCPRSWEPEGAEAFAELAQSLEPGTFVAKPRTGTGSSGVVYGERAPREFWTEHWGKHGAMLVQERVPAHGRGQGVSVLIDGAGRTVGAFAHERLQQYPNSGGPSTDRHGISAPELVRMSVRLLEAMKWRGIAMVEWKVDPRDGTPKLMEINPRFWGSLELAVRSGVDFPALYARAALGHELPVAGPYRLGVRCRWMIPGEILRYLTQDGGDRESPWRFLAGLPGMAEEWDARDLPGALGALVCTAGLALNPRYWKYVLRG